MRIYNLNRIRILLFSAILCFTILVLSLFQLSLLISQSDIERNLENADENQLNIDSETDPNSVKSRFIKVPLALSLLWNRKSTDASAKSENNDYARNDMQNDEEDEVEEEFNGESYNQIFKDSDFDLPPSWSFKSPLQYDKQYTNHGNSKSFKSPYWSNQIESMAPSGLTDLHIEKFMKNVKSSQVVKVEPPTWNKCGRDKNQYLVFANGMQVCARYRAPHHYLILGEVLSFYLSRLLGMKNGPTVTLVSTSDSNMWNKVWNVSLSEVWKQNQTVALIEWIDDLNRDRMPSLILDALVNNKTITSTSLTKKLGDTQLVELLQWSDLLIFDYITGNYDRVASMQDEASKENNTNILKDTIHNLVKSSSTNGIWMIDNESGLLDAYWVMYSNSIVASPDSATVRNESSFFITAHKKMLKTMCIFRKSTIRNVQRLHERKNSHKLLTDFVIKYEPLFKHQVLYLKPDYLNNFIRFFQTRIAEVYDHFTKYCNIKLEGLSKVSDVQKQR